MKTVTFILLVIALVSCGENTVEISKEEYDRLKGIKKDYPKPFYFKNSEIASFHDWSIILGEDNHEYLENDGGNGFVLIHYPDCKKCLKRDTL